MCTPFPPFGGGVWERDYDASLVPRPLPQNAENVGVAWGRGYSDTKKENFLARVELFPVTSCSYR
jgi:hypothetical protein